MTRLGAVLAAVLRPAVGMACCNPRCWFRYVAVSAPATRQCPRCGHFARVLGRGF